MSIIEALNKEKDKYAVLINELETELKEIDYKIANGLNFFKQYDVLNKKILELKRKLKKVEELILKPPIKKIVNVSKINIHLPATPGIVITPEKAVLGRSYAANTQVIKRYQKNKGYFFHSVIAGGSTTWSKEINKKIAAFTLMFSSHYKKTGLLEGGVIYSPNDKVSIASNGFRFLNQKKVIVCHLPEYYIILNNKKQYFEATISDKPSEFCIKLVFNQGISQKVNQFFKKESYSLSSESLQSLSKLICNNYELKEIIKS